MLARPELGPALHVSSCVSIVCYGTVVCGCVYNKTCKELCHSVAGCMHKHLHGVALLCLGVVIAVIRHSCVRGHLRLHLCDWPPCVSGLMWCPLARTPVGACVCLFLDVWLLAWIWGIWEVDARFRTSGEVE